MSSPTPQKLTNNLLATLTFRERLVAIRKQRGLTQQAVADIAGMNVVQIRRYETNVSQPSLEALKKLAKALGTTTDLLLFDEDERGPDDDLRLQFEAASRLTPEEKHMLRTLIEGMLLKHEATLGERRLARTG